MSAARQNICKRLTATRRAIADFNLQDLPLIPANDSHNNSVRIIRNGLAVQCFNILEDFAKARTAEVLEEISLSSVQFSHLPAELQRATTSDVIKAIDVQTRFLDNSDRIPYVQDYSARIASTTGSPMQLANIAFFHANSNISKDHFRDALKAFSIDHPWEQIAGLCSRLGLSGLPAEPIFISLARRRHTAAHNANASVSESDLLQSITDAFGLAVGFDILLSKAIKPLVSLRAALPPNTKLINNHRNFPLRFIKSVTHGFAEIKEGSTRNIRKNIDSEVLIPAALIRAKNENGVLAIFDANGFIFKWDL